jgi:hypothetical protein
LKGRSGSLLEEVTFKLRSEGCSRGQQCTEQEIKKCGGPEVEEKMRSRKELSVTAQQQTRKCCEMRL